MAPPPPTPGAVEALLKHRKELFALTAGGLNQRLWFALLWLWSSRCPCPSDDRCQHLTEVTRELGLYGLKCSRSH